MSVNSTNPTNLFGGTWERWGNGRVPISVNETDKSFNTSDKTGGSFDHNHSNGTLCAAMNMFISNIKSNDLGDLCIDYRRSSCSSYMENTRVSVLNQVSNQEQTNHNESNSMGVSVVGTTSSTNTIPKYITCYMWKRTK